MFFYRLKNFICVALAVIFCLFFAVGVKAVNITGTVTAGKLRGGSVDLLSSDGTEVGGLSVGLICSVRTDSFVTLDAYVPSA